MEAVGGLVSAETEIVFDHIVSFIISKISETPDSREGGCVR